MRVQRFGRYGSSLATVTLISPSHVPELFALKLCVSSAASASRRRRTNRPAAGSAARASPQHRRRDARNGEASRRASRAGVAAAEAGAAAALTRATRARWNGVCCGGTGCGSDEAARTTKWKRRGRWAKEGIVC